MLGVEDFEAKYPTPKQRYEHRKEIHACLERVLCQKPGAEWLRLLEAEDVWCGPVHTYDAVFTNPQVIHNKMVLEFEHPRAGKIKVTGIPVKLSKTPGQIRKPPPVLGEHTEEVLLESGYTPEEIATLRATGII
jgi:crotonobetainyl-CoA:carnitine CoA-transferase CaiB-like acyl-CoA transferase